MNKIIHHHHVHEGLGVFPFPWSSKWNSSLHLFLGRPMFLLPFGLHCNACFGILFVSILCTCCSHFSWYCFISFTIFSTPVFSIIHWFFSLPSFVIPSKCLKNFICAASKRCSSLFFSTQASLPNFNAALAVKSNPSTVLDRPWGFQEVEAPRFQDSRHMKVVRLSALRTGRLYPPGNIPGTHFC